MNPTNHPTTEDADQIVRRGRGRPEVGPMVNVRMPEDLIDWIDQQIKVLGYASRAEYIRHVLVEERAAVEHRAS